MLVIELDLVQGLLFVTKDTVVIVDDFPLLFCSDKIFSNCAKAICNLSENSYVLSISFSILFSDSISSKNSLPVLLKNVFRLNCLLMVLFLRDHLNFGQYHYKIVLLSFLLKKKKKKICCKCFEYKCV